MLRQIFKNKKAGEKVLSVWWFFILALIGLSTVAAVFMYYSAEVDVKEIEAGILADRVADCVIQQGYLNGDFIKQGKDFDVGRCGIDLGVIKSNNNFYIGVSAYESDSCNENAECSKRIDKLGFSAGAATIPEDCRIKEAPGIKEAKHFPRCSEKTLIVLNRYDRAMPERIVLKILAGSNQKGGIIV